MPKLSIKSAEIAEMLAEEIIRGEFSPGARLAQEHIAKRFSCSHVPVREALQRVVQMDLAVAVPRRGVRVVELSKAQLDEILAMRVALEPLAMRRSVAQVTSAQLEEIDAVRHACDAAQDPVSWEKSNRDFHFEILRPCAQARLLSEISSLQRLSAHRFHQMWQQHWVRATDRDHAAIFNSMARGDADAACALLVRHISRR